MTGVEKVLSLGLPDPELLGNVPRTILAVGFGRIPR